MRFIRFISIFFFIQATQPLFANSYEILDLAGESKGFFQATDLNHQGEVIGTYTRRGVLYRGAYWKDGKVKILEGMGPFGGKLQAINDSGVIAGELWMSKPNDPLIIHPAVWENFKVRDLGVLPGFTRATTHAILNDGRVIGEQTHQAIDAEFPDHRVVTIWEGVEAELIEGFNSHSNFTAANPAGDILGEFKNGNLYHHDGTFDFIDVDISVGIPQFRALNNERVIVGFQEIGQPPSYLGARWTNAELLSLPTLEGDVWSFARSINAHGAIVGVSRVNRPGYGSAVIWNPLGEVTDLNELVDPESPWHLVNAKKILDDGRILVSIRKKETAPDKAEGRSALLIPVE